MKHLSKNTLIFVLASAGLVAACGGDAPMTNAPAQPAAAEAAPAKPADGKIAPVKDAKPFGPVRISHRIIGTPVVGQPVLIDLELRSAYGSAPVELSYRVPDTSALTFPADQLQRVSLAAPPDGEKGATMAHQVSVVPQREGRLYLNVSAAVETADGPQSTVMAIPIQVGSAPRELEENGTIVEDASGELIRTLPAKED